MHDHFYFYSDTFNFSTVTKLNSAIHVYTFAFISGVNREEPDAEMFTGGACLQERRKRMLIV